MLLQEPENMSHRKLKMGIELPVYLDGIMNVFMKTAFALTGISVGLMRLVHRKTKQCVQWREHSSHWVKRNWGWLKLYCFNLRTSELFKVINRFLSPLVIVYRGSKTTVMLCVYVLVSQGCCNKLVARVGMRIGVHFKLQRFSHRAGDQKSNKGHLRPSLLASR